jgi:hypothetical protein
MARCALVAAGIDAEIGDEEMVAINWLYSNAVGGVKLTVPEEDLDRAAELLTNPAATDIADDVAPTFEPAARDAPIVPPIQTHCPECGSAESTRLPRLAIFALLALLMYGIGVVADQRDLAFAGVVAAALITAVLPPRRCTFCGTRWPDDPEDEPADVEAPPPGARDLIEELCPRCGSAEYHAIDHRRLKTLPFLFNPAAIVLAVMWPFVAKRQCDTCGFRR